VEVVTETEWLEAIDSWPMLRFLENQNPSRRKIHLFVCACCRRFHWDTMRSTGVQEAVLISEQFADGLATASELRTVRERLSWDGWRGSPQPVDQALWAAKVATGVALPSLGEYQTVAQALWGAKIMRGPRLWDQLTTSGRGRVRIQCDLLRDLFIPFAAAVVHPSWLSWKGSTVPKLARAIYEDQLFSDLPILADALEDAGCTDPDLLGHCRSPGLHVRGCWVVDALLGKT
jgi:hypothetical protein